MVRMHIKQKNRQGRSQTNKKIAHLGGGVGLFVLFLIVVSVRMGLFSQSDKNSQEKLEKPAAAQDSGDDMQEIATAAKRLMADKCYSPAVCSVRARLHQIERADAPFEKLRKEVLEVCTAYFKDKNFDKIKNEYHQAEATIQQLKDQIIALTEKIEQGSGLATKDRTALKSAIQRWAAYEDIYSDYEMLGLYTKILAVIEGAQKPLPPAAEGSKEDNSASDDAPSDSQNPISVQFGPNLTKQISDLFKGK